MPAFQPRLHSSSVGLATMVPPASIEDSSCWDEEAHSGPRRPPAQRKAPPPAVPSTSSCRSPHRSLVCGRSAAAGLSARMLGLIVLPKKYDRQRSPRPSPPRRPHHPWRSARSFNSRWQLLGTASRMSRNGSKVIAAPLLRLGGRRHRERRRTWRCVRQLAALRRWRLVGQQAWASQNSGTRTRQQTREPARWASIPCRRSDRCSHPDGADCRGPGSHVHLFPPLLKTTSNARGFRNGRRPTLQYSG